MLFWVEGLVKLVVSVCSEVGLVCVMVLDIDVCVSMLWCRL